MVKGQIFGTNSAGKKNGNGLICARQNRKEADKTAAMLLARKSQSKKITRDIKGKEGFKRRRGFEHQLKTGPESKKKEGSF